MPAKSAKPAAPAAKPKAAASKPAAPKPAAPKPAASKPAASKAAAPKPKPTATKAAAPKPAAKGAAPKVAAPAKGAAPKTTAPKAAAPKAAAPKDASQKAPAGKGPAGKGAARSQAAVTGVYVKNWGTGSAEEAAAVFKAAGNVVKAQIRRHRYALIFFDNAIAVKKAIDLFNEKEVLGSVVTVVPAKTTPKPDPHVNSSCVFVSPIFRSSTTKQQILELFAGYKVLRLRTYRRNFAYVYLDSPAAALKFLQAKNGAEFRGHKLRVALSTHSLEKLKSRQEAAKLLMAAHRHKKTTVKH